jgi:hypothetical protein
VRPHAPPSRPCAQPAVVLDSGALAAFAGLSLALAFFLTGLAVGCFCTLRSFFCILSCGLCCRDRRRQQARKDGRKKIEKKD